MTTDKELDQIRKLALEVYTCAGAAQQKKNSHARRTALRHKMHKAIGALKALQRDRELVGVPAPAPRKRTAVKTSSLGASPLATGRVLSIVDRRSSAR